MERFVPGYKIASEDVIQILPKRRLGSLFRPAQEGRADLEVYDVRGRRVRTLASGTLSAGLHTITWQGVDDRGGSVASGVYYLKMDFGGQVMTRRMTLVR